MRNSDPGEIEEEKHMTQQSLFPDSAADAEPVPLTCIDTRAAAVQAVAPIVPNMLRQVFDFITDRGPNGATDEEFAIALHMRESTARARRVELRDGGQVRDSQIRRKSRSGRLCIVWRSER
jgi:hypothetical protein